MIDFIQKHPLFWGPVFLLISLGATAKMAIPYDLLLVSSFGFILSAKLQIRGAAYSLAALGLIVAIRHAFFIEDHLWQLGIEGSIALGFLITALSFEEQFHFVNALECQIETQKVAFLNLEEEHSTFQETAQNQKILFQEKVDETQKELEELQIEYSSLLILNEVLRKTSAKQLKEAEAAKEQYRNAQISLHQLYLEKEGMALLLF